MNTSTLIAMLLGLQLPLQPATTVQPLARASAAPAGSVVIDALVDGLWGPPGSAARAGSGMPAVTPDAAPRHALWLDSRYRLDPRATPAELTDTVLIDGVSVEASEPH